MAEQRKTAKTTATVAGSPRRRAPKKMGTKSIASDRTAAAQSGAKGKARSRGAANAAPADKRAAVRAKPATGGKTARAKTAADSQRTSPPQQSFALSKTSTAGAPDSAAIAIEGPAVPDPGSAPAPAKKSPASRPLRGVSAIRAFFRRNTTPIYFVSPTAFNLLGVDRWISGFHYVNYYDSFGGAHPRVFVPERRPHAEFTSMEDVNNYLLAHPEFHYLVERNGGGKAVLVMFDEQTEHLAAGLGIDIALPSARLRHRIDSKLVTTRLGNEAGVPSAPNVLGSVGGYDELLALAHSAGLGEDLVVQLPWGDSGKTTFFVDSRDAWEKATSGHTLTGVDVKVMKRINCRPVAVEAVLTRHGTLVGPIMSDITGYAELTPYRGGWAGNDVYLDVLNDQQRARARVLTQHLGDRLGSEGYRGFFEVDFLVDTDTGELYLGELNPRLSGISSMTNVTAGAYAELPLFLFHLLEFLDVDYEIDVEEINARWADPDSVDVWSQLIIKQTDDTVGLITDTPQTGIWRTGPRGKPKFARAASDWHDLQDDADAFYLRVAGPGDYGYKGADLGILVSRARLQTDEYTLTPLCKRWVGAVRSLVAITPLDEMPAAATVPGKG